MADPIQDPRTRFKLAIGVVVVVVVHRDTHRLRPCMHCTHARVGGISQDKESFRAGQGVLSFDRQRDAVGFGEANVQRRRRVAHVMSRRAIFRLSGNEKLGGSSLSERKAQTSCAGTSVLGKIEYEKCNLNMLGYPCSFARNSSLPSIRLFSRSTASLLSLERQSKPWGSTLPFRGKRRSAQRLQPHHIRRS